MFISLLKPLVLILAFCALAACAEKTGENRNRTPANPVETGEAAAFDPVTMDPASIDKAHPPTTIELTFDSHGASLNGHLYLANGAGPHPTVVLLHGLPGNERNLDIAQAARRAGFNVLFFHYRGAWGSQGDYSFTHVVEDAGAAAAFLRSENPIAEYRVDPVRISYLGHSMGGFAALTAGARDKKAICIAAMSPADPGVIAASFADEATRDGFSAYMDAIGEPGGGPLAGVTGAIAVADIVDNREAYSMPPLAPEFAGRPVLLTAARGDTVLPPEAFHEPLAAAYEAEPQLNLTQIMFESDHVYSWERLALTRAVVGWLGDNCR